jgi:hypothetical protein
VRNVLVVTLSTGVLATACGHHSAAAPGGWIEVHDLAAGVALRMPAGWHVHRHGNWCMRGGPGVIVSNVPWAWRRVQIVDGCTTAWHLEAVPPTFRAVEVAGFASPFVGKHTTKLPITLSHAQRSPDGESVSVFRGRRVWFVNAYLGGDVSPHDPTLEAIVRTIRFNR